MTENISFHNTGLDSDPQSQYSLFYNIYKFSDSENDSFTGTNNASLFNLSKEHEQLFTFIVSGIGITLVATMGVIGNVFSILVLSKRKMRSPIGCFLLGLAIADALFVFIGTTLVGIPSFLSYFGALGDFGLEQQSSSKLVLLTPIFFGLGLTSQTASTYFTLAVTFERYVAVCHPFKARTMLTLKRAYYIAFGVVLFSLLYNSPRWWEYEAKPIYDEITHEIIAYKPGATSLRFNYYYDIYYVYLSYLIFINILPVVVLSVLNILIYKRIREANKRRQTLSSSQKQENSLALMLLVIVGIFLVCNTLPLIETTVKATTGIKDNIVELECIRNFFVMFNSSINFVIYCFFGEKFREVFIQMWPQWIRNHLCCCCPATRTNSRYWNGSLSDGSVTDKNRISMFLSSSKSGKDVPLEKVFISRI